MAFQIESTAFCNNGLAPRWAWWVHGIRNSRRFGIVGTDEQGQGLYLLQPNGDSKPRLEQLIDPKDFSVPSGITKAEAVKRVIAALQSLGWQPSPAAV